MHVEEVQARGSDTHGTLQALQVQFFHGIVQELPPRAGCITGAGPAPPSMLTETYARA
jgi:hypothetical protein